MTSLSTRRPPWVQTVVTARVSVPNVRPKMLEEKRTLLTRLPSPTAAEESATVVNCDRTICLFHSASISIAAEFHVLPSARRVLGPSWRCMTIFPSGHTGLPARGVYASRRGPAKASTASKTRPRAQSWREEAIMVRGRSAATECARAPLRRGSRRRTPPGLRR